MYKRERERFVGSFHDDGETSHFGFRAFRVFACDLFLGEGLRNGD